LIADPADQANQETKADSSVSRVGALDRDSKSSAHVDLGSHKKIVKAAVARKNCTIDEYGFLKSDSSTCLDNLNFSARSKKLVTEKPEKPKKVVNEKLERPTKQVNGRLEGPNKFVSEKPEKLKKQVEEKLVRLKKQVDEIPEKPKKHVDEKLEKPKKHVDEKLEKPKKPVDEKLEKPKKPVDEKLEKPKKHVDEKTQKSKKHVVEVTEKPEKQVGEKADKSEKPGKPDKHVDDKPGKPKKLVNEKLERSTKQVHGKPERPKKHGDVVPEKTEKQVNGKAEKFKKDVDKMPGKPVKQVHEKAKVLEKSVDEKAGKPEKSVDEKAKKSKKHVDEMSEKSRGQVEKSEMKSIKDIDGRSTFRHSHVSTLESDSSMRSQDTSNSAKHKRKMSTDAISGGENHQLLKESKKARLNQGDTYIYEQDNGTRLSNDSRELDVTATAKMRTEEYPLAGAMEEVKKKKKEIREKDGAYSNIQDVSVPTLSHRDKLRQLLRSQSRQKVGNRGKDLTVESENVPAGTKSKTLTVEPQDVSPSKRKLTEKGDHETANEEVDYKTMNEPCNFVTVEAGEDVFHARKRLKRLKRLNGEKDVEELEKSSLVPAEEITYASYGDDTRRDNESGVRIYFTSTDCNSTDVDVNKPLSQHAKDEEVTGRFLDLKTLDETDPFSLPFGCTPKSLNPEQEGPVERTTHSKDGHSTLVKKAMVKRYIPLPTKKQWTSDAPVSHEKPVQGKVRRYSREELQEVAADSEDTRMSDTFGPDSLSALIEQEPTAMDQAREPLTTAKEQASTIKSRHKVECKTQIVSNHDSTCFEYPDSGRKASARTKKVKFGKSGKIVLEGRGNKSVILSKSSWSATKALEAVPRMKLMKAKSIAKNEPASHCLAKLEMKTRNSGKSARSDIISAVPTAVGCARCSITGWEWRTWARDRAKRRLQRRVKTAIGKEVKQDLKKLRRATKKKETNISNSVTTAVIAGLQVARKNRADMRKLAIAADGSDLLRFNMLKVAQAAASKSLQVYTGLFDFYRFFCNFLSTQGIPMLKYVSEAIRLQRVLHMSSTDFLNYRKHLSMDVPCFVSGS
jgi:hypothetical protein